MNARKVILVIVLILVVGSIVWLESRKTEQGSGPAEDVVVMSREEKIVQYEPAKEITTPDAFINTDGVTIGEFVGKNVVLVDFWTYSCINCQRTLPHLNDWYEKYADDGLVIVGIHTPEFEFEKDLANVKRAVEKFGIKYPVVLDNDYSTWQAYKNRYWPRKYLVDIDGYIVYDHIGEGGYDETEAKIVELLNERKQVLGEEGSVRRDASGVVVDDVDFSKVESPEMYFGAERIQNIGNLPSGECLGGSCQYTRGSDLLPNTFQLLGTWTIEKDMAVLNSNSGSIFLRFSANKVNIVAGADNEISGMVYLDGEMVTSSNSGADVKNGSVLFSAQDLYNLIDLGGEYGEHVLELRLDGPGLSAFTFTFG